VHVTTADVTLERLLGAHLEAFAAAGFRVVGASAPGPYAERLAARGIEHIALEHATRAAAPVEDARALGELVACFRRLRPTIVHTHNPKPGLYGRLAARAARVPVIVNTVHGLYALPEDPWRKRVLVYGLERIAAACSHAELLQNEEDVPVLRKLGVPAARISVLGNGIDLTRFDPAHVDAADRDAARRELGARAPGDVVVGLVGRLVREKGYPTVFDAVRRLRDRHPDVQVAVVGPADPDKDDALSRAELDAAEADGVRFLGDRDDVMRLYAGMDVYVLASHREGFPRSAMEAAAMGVPIVATDIRGCRQVVEHGVTGFLFERGDADALATRIAALACDPDLRRRMGAAAYAKARREFDERRCIEITLDTYRRLLAARAPGGVTGGVAA
jgi:glycosyltransferase involved in cell wall biosynthesis